MVRSEAIGERTHFLCVKLVVWYLLSCFDTILFAKNCKIALKKHTKFHAFTMMAYIRESMANLGVRHGNILAFNNFHLIGFCKLTFPEEIFIYIYNEYISSRRSIYSILIIT